MQETAILASAGDGDTSIKLPLAIIKQKTGLQLVNPVR
jgi:hypothetical protein